MTEKKKGSAKNEKVIKKTSDEAREVIVKETKMVENFLKGYVNNKRQLKLEKYEAVYFGRAKGVDEVWYSEPQKARERMDRVHDFVTEMDNGEEKLFLYFHYVRGENMEKCAELLGVSRSTAFRLRRRALNMARIRAKRLGNIIPEIQASG